ncbi:radical SAM/SPASM protein FxsB, inactivated metallohydrolase extension form [Streptomyces sp. JH14]|uniref:radical SAM/SPASM protein FxsBH, inactivated beta-hydroxylase extension form n=1 Tax=Streptomyces sp. JH14 TaxID=2793630 RepID=UPI0023F8EAA0|nr:radical SAM/SPASM protein FxsB, inactivated metallohydrolase extension form [Streptomyces sp. JH14]MDF6041572.1 radical SAM/SPASM protein FxsB, inactivated metallohydrolase extension form [Streptomyces sp. JH14]
MTGPLVPFREIVLKVHSRCDLACDHCYVYEHADQSWRTRPKTISDEVIFRTARRLAEHAKTHALPSVSVILHGGEPLLAGPARLRRICEELTAAFEGVAELDLRIHTNGLQLSPRYLDLFSEYDVKVGISLDGDREANDRHRRFADGRSSHPLVLKAVELLRQERYRHLNLGLLCTIDIENDPRAVLDALVELDPPLIDFLLPHATWDEPPSRPDGSRTAYADWLLAVFDRWQEQGRPVPVRLFSSVLSTLSGGPSLTESLGLAPTDLVVVETDGQLEQVDSLKSAYEGAAATGFDVFTHAFDEVAAHPGVRARQLGLDGVSETCRSCPVVRSCGGGLYTHRYKSVGAVDPTLLFDHPSVYCDDLKALVLGIEERTAASVVPPAVAEPVELAVAQQDLTRTMLALLHSDLDGRGGDHWAAAWELAVTVEGSEKGSRGLDEALAHPYARSWLHDALSAVHEERPDAGRIAWRLSSYVAAAAVRAGLDLAVPVAYRDGTLALPGLGALRIDGPEAGTVGVRATEDGFLVRRAGDHGDSSFERRIVRGGEAGRGWLPVRRLGGGAPGSAGDAGPGSEPGSAPDWVLDDLDPYRGCFTARPAAGLRPDEAGRLSAALGSAWVQIVRRTPRYAAEMADGLTTLTPLTGLPPGEPSVGRHGYGALGIRPDESAGQWPLTLVRGFRRAKLRALLDVTDLYAADGSWEHRMPWREEPVPLSRLLAETYERVALGAFEPHYLDGVPQALETLERAAELTVSGKQVLDLMRKEI